MKIINNNPPNIDKIKKAFPIVKGTIFCYGDSIYNPDGMIISEDLIIHEGIHQKQQGDKIEEWWDKYISDKEFRLEQELEAYRNQYNYALEKYPRNKRKFLL